MCELLTVTVPQLSVAVGAVHVTDLLHVVLPTPVYTVISAGTPETTGAVLSSTVIVVLLVLCAPFESVTVNITLVTPIA